MFRNVALTVAAVVASPIALGAQHASTTTTPPAAATISKLRVGTDPWIAWEPLVIADANGFWRDLGLDIELVVYRGAETPQALRAGQLDFATVMVGTAVGIALEQPKPAIRILGEIDWSHGGDKIVVGKGRTLADCKGQRIGVYEQSPALTMFLDRYAQSVGMRLRDFELVEISDNEALVANFLAGRLAAVIAYEPHVERALQSGKATVLATTADLPGVMPECLVARADRELPAAAVEAFVRGWCRAVAWCADPKHAAERDRVTLKQLFPDEHLTAKDLADMRADVRMHDLAVMRARNLEPDGLRAFVTDVLTHCRVGRGSASKLTADDLLDLRALRTVLADPAVAPATPAGR